jgi:hypothetical protein
MKRTIFSILTVLAMLLLMSNSSCDSTPTADEIQQQQTEKAMSEANRQVGMPAIVNYQEKKFVKWIYELCDQEDLVCHAYLFNSIDGKVGQYLGQCIGYGIPYSTQFSNPEKRIKASTSTSGWNYNIPQPEPNGLFKPEGLSATWLIMIDPETKQPRPVYVEPEIIVSPFKLH